MKFEMIIGLALVVYGLFLPLCYDENRNDGYRTFLKAISVVMVTLGGVLIWFSTLP